MTHEFKPGDKVIVRESDVASKLIASVEGWWLVEWPTGTREHVRPSELTPADPGPDAATLRVRELCAAERLVPSRMNRVTHGDFDDDPFCLAFAKYIRANPPQPLTFDVVRTAISNVYGNCSIPRAEEMLAALHAALTEQRA